MSEQEKTAYRNGKQYLDAAKNYVKEAQRCFESSGVDTGPIKEAVKTIERTTQKMDQQNGTSEKR